MLCTEPGERSLLTLLSTINSESAGCLFACLFTCLLVYLFTCLLVYLFICLSVYLFICLFV